MINEILHKLVLKVLISDVKDLPAVEFLARQLKHRYSGKLVDLILLLWLYSNPYETRRRTFASLCHVLKHTKDFQRPDGKPNVTDEELTKIVVSALQRLKKKSFVKVYSQDTISAQISLTEEGVNFVLSELTPESLKFLDNSGHIT